MGSVQRIGHVVWDWNGTLFDDLHVVVDAVNEGVEPLGLGPITVETYRDHYTRPVKRFYDRLAGRELSHDEWLELDRRFHDAYRTRLTQAALAAEAVTALRLVRERAISQSLLSMFPHAELSPLVDRLGVAGFFSRIDGLRGTPGANKAPFLESHLRGLARAVPAEAVLVVGDTPDDVEAALHVGAAAVLVDTGGHHRHELERSGVPVAGGLVEALRLAGLASL